MTPAGNEIAPTVVMATLNLDDPRQARYLAPILAIGGLVLLILIVAALIRAAI